MTGECTSVLNCFCLCFSKIVTEGSIFMKYFGLVFFALFWEYSFLWEYRLQDSHFDHVCHFRSEVLKETIQNITTEAVKYF